VTPTHLLVFDNPVRTVEAVRALRAGGFTVTDVHSPFPLHGVDDALGLPETRLPWATLGGALLGGGLAFGFQAWTHTASWPLNIGGKPNLSLPALVPVGFELTVLFAAFCTAAVLSILAVAARPRRTDMPPITDVRVTDDRFAVLVSEASVDFSVERFRKLCDDLSPVERVEAWRSS
jgi:hypothetical protein